ncbi:MAG: TRM11 family SAM-dependent methyltransferase [Bacillus sp. (in: firmicutes)]
MKLLSDYLYTYNYSEEEERLCALELRMLFGQEADDYVLKSSRRLNPDRSPFLKNRIDISCEADTLDELKGEISRLPRDTRSFKTIYVRHKGRDGLSFEERRRVEREAGLAVLGSADLRNPEVLFGILQYKERWYFGEYHESKAVWLQNQEKPRQYSTALSTRVARAVVNIAVPDPEEVKAIDPCCGIGTVLVEALSMGIDIEGRDINPLAVIGARENIAHFGYKCHVAIGAIQDVENVYDTAIIDLPYNHCTTASAADQMSIIRNAGRIAARIILVTGEPMDEMIQKAGLEIVDRGDVKKIGFERQVLVCRNRKP